MKLDEETFLTAYIDGALDPEQRLRVESALLSKPGLSDDLRALGVVRDLVSGLARPALPVDLSATVIATIRRREHSVLGRLPGVLSGSWTARAVALLSSAAALVAAASIGIRSPVIDASSGKLFAEIRAPGVMVPLPISDRSLIETADESLRPPLPSATAVADLDESDRDQDVLRVRRLLDSPNLNKVFIVTDVVGRDPERQVGAFLETTPRRNASFGRFTVSQAIVIDPKHPGEATVFAVVMDDQEIQQFRAELARSFPTGVEEVEPRPEVVTELAEVGQVSIFPGTTIAKLIETADRANSALKDDLRRRNGAVSFSRPIPGGDPLSDPAGFPLAEREDPPLSPENSRPGRTTPASLPGRRTRSGESVVLVWVMNPRRDGADPR